MIVNFFYKICTILYRKTQALFGIPSLGVRAIVLNEKREVLLVRHTYQSGWFLPGGGVKRKESIIAAVIRELKEETGICVIGTPKLFGVYIHFILGATDYPALFIVTEYSQVKSANPEIAEWGWFQYAQIPEATAPGSKRRLEEYFNNAVPSERW